MKDINNYIQEKLNISTEYTRKPKNTKQLRRIIEKRLKEDEDANLNDIDVSGITDMSYLFYGGLDPHNIDISEWDVSNVKDMKWMFSCCGNFNSDLSSWDVSKVTNMEGMFYECKKFDCDLNEWDVSNVTNIGAMFIECDSLKNKPTWYNEKTK